MRKSEKLSQRSSGKVMEKSVRLGEPSFLLQLILKKNIIKMGSYN